jgi:hypothetical protein
MIEHHSRSWRHICNDWGLDSDDRAAVARGMPGAGAPRLLAYEVGGRDKFFIGGG